MYRPQLRMLLKREISIWQSAIIFVSLLILLAGYFGVLEKTNEKQLSYAHHQQQAEHLLANSILYDRTAVVQNNNLQQVDAALLNQHEALLKQLKQLSENAMDSSSFTSLVRSVHFQLNILKTRMNDTSVKVIATTTPKGIDQTLKHNDATIRKNYLQTIQSLVLAQTERKQKLDRLAGISLWLLRGMGFILVLFCLKVVLKLRELFAKRSQHAYLLNNLISSTNEGFIYLDKTFQVLLINHKAQVYFQAYTGKWLEAGDFMNVKLSETSDAILRKGMGVVKSGNIFHQERSVIMDGQVRIGEYEFRPIIDASSNELAGVNVLIRDITEKKQQEAEITDLLERISLINGLVQLGTWQLNPATDLMVFDEVSRKMLELTPDVPINAEARKKLIHADDLESVEKGMRQLGTQAKEVEMNFRVVTPETNIKYIYQKAICRFNENGTVKDIIGGMVDLTAHKKAEARFRQMFDTSPNALILLNQDGSIEMANTEAFHLIGYAEQELNGISIYQLLSKTSSKHFHKLLQELHGKEDQQLHPGNEELTIITKDGKSIVIDLRLSRMELDGKQMVISSLVNISSRKAAEVERKELLTRFELAASATCLGIWDYDIYNDKLVWNGYMYELCGIESNTPVTLSQWLSLIDPADLPAITMQFDALHTKVQKEWHTTFRINLPNGGSKILEQHIITLTNEKGEIFRCLGTALDVTDSKQAEAKHQELIKRFNLAADTLHLGILDADLYTGNVRGDQRLIEMLEMDPVETIHLDAWINKVHPQDIKRLQLELQEVLQQEKMLSTEWRQIRKDGSLKYYETKALILWEGGQPYRAIAATIDVTDKVIQRIELVGAKKRAEQSEALQEQFLANMSHEIRTPLNGILGIADLMGRSQLTEQQRQNLTIIQNSSQSLLTIINDVLDISKIKSGKLNIEKEPFLLNSVVETAFELLQFKASQKGLSYNMQIDPEVPSVLIGDPGRLSQILINLLANAVKFTRTGGVCINVDVAFKSGATYHIRFAITDTGIGISENQLGKIFDSFSQADNRIGVEFGGTGLGLTISKKLIELQNGDIEVSSELGQGSVFSVVIPYQLAPHSNEIVTSQISGNVPEYIKGKKVLVAEDNEVNRIVINEYLQQAGLDITMVNDGQQAVHAISGGHFDLVILDLRMPILNGFEVAGVIRNEFNLSVPIMALTASTLRSEKEHCLTIGMNAYLAKPFKPVALFDTIYSLLANKKVEEIEKELIPETLDAELHGQVLEMEVLQSMGDKKLVLQLLEHFKTYSKSTLTEMSEAIGQDNQSLVYDLAHRLKGSAGMLGLNRFADMLRKMEHLTAVNTNDFKQAADFFTQIMKEYNQLDSVLNKAAIEVNKWS